MFRNLLFLFSAIGASLNDFDSLQRLPHVNEGICHIGKEYAVRVRIPKSEVNHPQLVMRCPHVDSEWSSRNKFLIYVLDVPSEMWLLVLLCDRLGCVVVTLVS